MTKRITPLRIAYAVHLTFCAVLLLSFLPEEPVAPQTPPEEKITPVAVETCE